MGNRGGRLHRPDRTLGLARWRSRAWIACVTAFHGRHRLVMGEGYTELFFLDEPTALAAGHRPCYECRRADARAFAAAWGRAAGTPPPTAGDIDRVLHVERLAPPETTSFSALPAGAMFMSDGGFFLRTGAGALAWSFAGYRPGPAFAPAETVRAITPPATRRALAAGYAARPHPSAGQLSAR